MSSASDHWTRCDADMCPYPNGSSDQWTHCDAEALPLLINSLSTFIPI